MWVLIIIVLVLFFKVPSRMTEYLAELPKLVQNLSPKFYVALTGTSSFLSGINNISKFPILNQPLGLILIFEWWYFKRNGQSFIEQLSLTHLGPWINPDETFRDAQNGDKAGFECKGTIFQI